MSYEPIVHCRQCGEPLDVYEPPETRFCSQECRDIFEPRKTLTDGSQIYPEHKNLKPNGQQNDYVVLAESERALGFVRPVRRSYIHQKCGSLTTMSQAIAETYARDPYFYSGTFCCACGKHFPVGEDGEFFWADDPNQKVGT